MQVSQEGEPAGKAEPEESGDHDFQQGSLTGCAQAEILAMGYGMTRGGE